MSGIMWKGLVNGFAQVLQFAVTIVLARLLSPDDYGVFGMAAVFTGLVSNLHTMGLTAALVQRDHIEEEHLTSTFWAVLAAGCILCLLNVAAAPLVAWYFRKPVVASLVMVNAVRFCLLPLGNIHYTIFHRRMEFRKIALAETLDPLVICSTQIILACLGWGVWSLVIAGLFADVVGIVVLWGICPWRPTFRFSFPHFRDLFRFGSQTMGANAVTYLSNNIDYVIVGRFLGSAALGYYTLAFNLMSLPQRHLLKIVTPVVFPAFSKLQDDDERLRQAFLKSVAYIALICFPLLAALMILAPDLVPLVYSAKWKPAVVPLQIMCVAGAFYAISTTTGSIFMAKGRPDIHLKVSLYLRLGVLGAFLLAGARFGIIGIASATAIYSVIVSPIIIYIAGKLIRLPAADCLKALLPVLASAALMASGLLAFRAGAISHPVIRLAVAACLGFAIYAASIYILNRPLVHAFIGIFRRKPITAG